MYRPYRSGTVVLVPVLSSTFTCHTTVDRYRRNGNELLVTPRTRIAFKMNNFAEKLKS